MIAVTYRFGVTSNAGFLTSVPVGRDLDAEYMRDFARAPLFNRNAAAIGQCQIESRNGRRHVKRNVVLLRQHRHAVGADLVGDVAIGGDPVRAHHDARDLAGMQKMPGHVVRNQCRGNAVMLQFPHGQPRALQERPGLVGVIRRCSFRDSTAARITPSAVP